MFKKIIFQAHWLVGITAGVVLAVVGVTGASLSFEQEILRLLNPGVMTVEPDGAQRLSPYELFLRVKEQQPHRRITALSFSTEPGQSARVTLANDPARSGAGAESRSTANRPNGQGSAVAPNRPAQAAAAAPGRRGESYYVNPYTGELLGKELRGEKTLHVSEDLHRRLAAGPIGKAIVGASTLLLVGLCLSGLYLRWPRKPLNWRTWFTFSFALKGRSFLWHLHAVAGAWLLLFYLVAGLTGLYWSYDWYRNGLFAITGTTRPAGPNVAQRGDAAPAQRRGLDTGDSYAGVAVVWEKFEVTVPGFSTINLTLPRSPTEPYEIRYLDAEPAHERAYNRLTVDPVSGAIVQHERYDTKPAGGKIMSSIFVLHSGGFLGRPGLVLMMLASLGMPIFAVTGWMLYLQRRARKRAVRRAQAGMAIESGGPARDSA